MTIHFKSVYVFTGSIQSWENVGTLLVLDMLGRQVEIIDRDAVKNIQRDAVKNIQSIGSSLRAGMYVIQIYEADRTRYFKVIKK